MSELLKLEATLNMEVEECDRFHNRCDCNRVACQGRSYIASLSRDDGEQEHIERGSNYRVLLTSVKDEAFCLGITCVLINDPWGCTVGPQRIRATARRKALREDYIVRMAEVVRGESERHKRYSDYVALAKLMETDVNPTTIKKFYTFWREVTGYGNDLFGQGKMALSPAKSTLIKSVLDRAQQDNWPHGIKRDPNARTRYSHVLYVDTPEGQASFHIAYSEYADLPRYTGDWSGKKDTDQVLMRLYGQSPNNAAAGQQAA